MNTDSIIEKIKKAIRLANKTNSDGERDTAMRLARNLAEKNGIAFDDIEAGENEARAVKVDDADAHIINGSEFGHICFILKEHFGVIVMFNRLSNGKTRLTWFGCSLNIDIAKHVFHILKRECNKAWKMVRNEIVSTKMSAYERYGIVPVKNQRIRYGRETFMKGFFWSIHETLTNRPIRNDLDQLALERKAAEKKLKDFENEHSVRHTKARNGGVDAESLAKGFHMGSKVNLSRPCENRRVERMAIGM